MESVGWEIERILCFSLVSFCRVRDDDMPPLRQFAETSPFN